ncbi:MAG: DUF4194 domain-containing protein [Candidatus Marinarcus sp.]|uniref:DUF4194 domain-containing protein n=1 Tax=Candidatus Marinarcus sp. TaxID=3100987 RepID=UPI003B001BC9
MNIYNKFDDELKNNPKGHDIEIFSDVVNYLLERGVIIREDTTRETELYDYFVDFENHIEDFFAIMRVQVYHNSDQQNVRIFAPASKTPDEVNGVEVSNSFSQKLNNEESAYLIALAIIYDQKLRSNAILDDYSVEVEFEEFSIALSSSLGYIPTENKTERKNALTTLKRLRAVDFSENVFESSDNVLIIRKYIRDLVRDNMIDPYMEDRINNED